MTEWMRGNELEMRAAGGDLGGTMRLGAYKAKLAEGSRIADIYGSTEITERHRHRYEVNMGYRDKLEAKGMIFAGVSPDGLLPETVEYSGASLVRRRAISPRAEIASLRASSLVRELHRGSYRAEPAGLVTYGSSRVHGRTDAPRDTTTSSSPFTISMLPAPSTRRWALGSARATAIRGAPRTASSNSRACSWS